MDITPLKQHFEDIDKPVRYCHGCKEYHPYCFFKTDDNDETGLAKYCKAWDWILNQVKGAFKRNCERNRHRSIEGKRLFEFSIDDAFVFNQFLKQDWCCYYTGEEFEFPWIPNGSVQKKFIPTLDRFDNEVGYTKENTVIAVHWFNSFKKNRNIDELSNHIRNQIISLNHVDEVLSKLRQK